MGLTIIQSAKDLFAAMESYLDAGVVMVHLIPGLPGVKVPPQFQKQPLLRLNFSYRFGISDFAVDERGVRASLSFGGNNFFCDVPWSSVLAISSQPLADKTICIGNLSPDSMIEQLAMVLSPMEATQLYHDIQTGKVVIDENAEVEDTDEDDDPDDDPPPAGGWGQLRLV